jgi:8-oxo-dGTP pyrophosphatase MutT (NUDIX family)
VRERPTARVLLLDPVDRILLLKGRLPSDPHAPGAWFTVGGGIEPGESLYEAAAREVREETGLADIVLGPVAWCGEVTLLDRKQRPVLFKDTFILARCGGGEVTQDGWQDLEREFVDDMRWWTLDDLAVTSEPVWPADLAVRLMAVLHLAPGNPANCGNRAF